jgi:phage shock protein C
MEGDKKLMRPREGRVIAGVCVGLGRYFGLDPTLIRLLWVLSVCLLFTGFLAYVICWIVIPEEEAPAA